MSQQQHQQIERVKLTYQATASEFDYLVHVIAQTLRVGGAATAMPVIGEMFGTWYLVTVLLPTTVEWRPELRTWEPPARLQTHADPKTK